MKVFLSHAMSPYDGPIAARLRAVAAAYDIQIVLPERTRQGMPYAAMAAAMISCDAVVALITRNATQVSAVNRELEWAAEQKKPIIVLAEDVNLVQGVPKNQLVIFDRSNPTAHEHYLMTALKQINKQQKEKQLTTTLGWIAGIALGLLALSALTADEK